MTVFCHFWQVNIFNSRDRFFSACAALVPVPRKGSGQANLLVGAQENQQGLRLAGGGYPHGGNFALKIGRRPVDGTEEEGCARGAEGG
jgi:hypothetical protein